MRTCYCLLIILDQARYRPTILFQCREAFARSLPQEHAYRRRYVPAAHYRSIKGIFHKKGADSTGYGIILQLRSVSFSGLPSPIALPQARGERICLALSFL